MEQERVEKRHHIVVVADHGQGHINPMLQFSKRLVSKGIKITLATTLSNVKALKAVASSDSMIITFESIYDDCTEGGVVGPGGFKGFLDRFQASGSTNLTKLILDQPEYPVKCLVYDAHIHWASKVTAQLGIAGASFFTQSCAAAAAYYSMYCEVPGRTHLSMHVSPMIMTGLPKIKFPEVPSLGSSTGPYPPIIMHILGQFDNFGKADWVIFNSFDKLEQEVVDWMKNLWSAITIGPTLPSFYLDKRVKTDKEYGFNIHNPIDSSTCMEWLDNKKTGSVVYVSFGSAANLSAEQIAEVADALRRSNITFLWVVKPAEQIKLPCGFINETSGKGLVVTWCSQLEVLAHHAVGCFISHCGWNSTLEAISFGVPIIAMPQILDQIINAHFVEKLWRVGLMPKLDDDDGEGVTTSDEICRCIMEVLEGERGQEIKKNITCLKEFGKEAIDKGGSSDKHIDEFIAQLDPVYLRHSSNNC